MNIFRQPSPAVRARTRALIPDVGELGACRGVLRPLFRAPLPGLAVAFGLRILWIQGR